MQSIRDKSVHIIKMLWLICMLLIIAIWDHYCVLHEYQRSDDPTFGWPAQAGVGFWHIMTAHIPEPFEIHYCMDLIKSIQALWQTGLVKGLLWNKKRQIGRSEQQGNPGCWSTDKTVKGAVGLWENGWELEAEYHNNMLTVYGLHPKTMLTAYLLLCHS